MERTRYKYLAVSDQRRELPQPPLQVPHDPDRPIVELPPPAKTPVDPLDLRELIEGRRSVREYADEPVSLAELSYLLWCSQGVKKVVGDRVTFRTVPSGGARHALETYVLVNRVEGVGPGLYRFLAIEHQLELIAAGPEPAAAVTTACLDQQFVATGAATFLWIADVYRMTWRYGQRGYRYLHLDAGHACQNLYLAAESIGCGVCAIAAFNDEDLSEALGVDGKDHLPIYVATMGRKP